MTNNYFHMKLTILKRAGTSLNLSLGVYSSFISQDNYVNVQDPRSPAAAVYSFMVKPENNTTAELLNLKNDNGGIELRRCVSSCTRRIIPVLVPCAESLFNSVQTTKRDIVLECYFYVGIRNVIIPETVQSTYKMSINNRKHVS